MQDITPSDSGGTVPAVSTADTPWDQMYVKDRYARDRVMKAARLLLPLVKDNELILDVGCFTQEAAKYYPKWFKYLGIDQRAYHPKTQVMDLNHGFAPIPCAAALCLETLEHLQDPEDCLLSIKASLQENGHLVVSLPNEATLFHRLRGLAGTPDAECFSGEGKHLHLPSLRQARGFLAKHFEITRELYYISPSACGSRAPWLGVILSLIPDGLHQWLADVWPSLFARGFIFLLRKPIEAGTGVPLDLKV